MYRNQDCKMLQGKSNLVIKIKTASGGERHQINQLVRIYFQQINRSDLFCKLAVNTKCKEIFTPQQEFYFCPIMNR